MLNLKNPFIFAPIKTGYGTMEGHVTEKHLSFYRKRATYLGAIIPEPFYLAKNLRELPTQMGIDNDDKIDGLRRLVAVLKKDGAKAVAHLNHPGRMANPKIPGNVFLSPGDAACEAGGAAPRRMSLADIDDAVFLYADAAHRADKAGFDILELQFGHGYLPAQFLSTKVNDREDEYGGCLENRARFALRVLEAVKGVSRLPVIIRLSGDEMISDGIKLPETLDFCKMLESRGVEALHVSAGTVCSTPPWYFQHMFVPKGKTWEFADRIRETVSVPVIYVGRISTFEDIRELREKRKAEYLALGRALVADPDFIGKYLGEVSGAYRPCLACAEGCLGGVKAGKGLQCLVNPTLEHDFPLEKAENPKKYAVVGGGLAGMEAALTLKRRGHTVELFEKNELGGQFNLAPLTPHKDSMAALVPYYVEELTREGIPVHRKEAVAADLKESFDGVVLATGSVPIIPDFEGLKEYRWAEILRPENLPQGKGVLIIGGGLIGVDIATALIPRGNHVTIVKRTTDFGGDMEAIAKTLSLKIMRENNVRFSDHTHIKKIDGRTVYAEREGKEIVFDHIDLIVVSTGMKSYRPLEEELGNDLPVYIVGDARKTGNAQEAIADAYKTAAEI